MCVRISGMCMCMCVPVCVRTIVTMYALKNLDADDLSHLTESKPFVGRNELLGELRTDMSGGCVLYN